MKYVIFLILTIFCVENKCIPTWLNETQTHIQNITGMPVKCSSSGCGIFTCSGKTDSVAMRGYKPKYQIEMKAARNKAALNVTLFSPIKTTWIMNFDNTKNMSKRQFSVVNVTGIGRKVDFVVTFYVAMKDTKLFATVKVETIPFTMHPVEDLIVDISCLNTMNERSTASLTTSSIASPTPMLSTQTTTIQIGTSSTYQASATPRLTAIPKESKSKLTTIEHVTTQFSPATKPSHMMHVSTTQTMHVNTTPFTTKSKKDNEAHSKPAKIVLVVLAVLIIIAVVAVYLYFKNKRKLSDQPAFYNDIAMNDPLRTELDAADDTNFDGNGDDDDDELPLFA